MLSSWLKVVRRLDFWHFDQTKLYHVFTLNQQVNPLVDQTLEKQDGEDVYDNSK